MLVAMQTMYTCEDMRQESDFECLSDYYEEKEREDELTNRRDELLMAFPNIPQDEEEAVEWAVIAHFYKQINDNDLLGILWLKGQTLDPFSWNYAGFTINDLYNEFNLKAS